MKEWYRKPLTKCSVIAFRAYEHDPSLEAFTNRTSLKYIVVSLKKRKESRQSAVLLTSDIDCGSEIQVGWLKDVQPLLVQVVEECTASGGARVTQTSCKFKIFLERERPAGTEVARRKTGSRITAVGLITHIYNKQILL